jgi:pyruvate dehydrogenase (quinone)
LPGDGINGVMEAIRKRNGEIRFIQVRHENPRRSWPARIRSGPGASAAASRPPGRVAYTC